MATNGNLNHGVQQSSGGPPAPTTSSSNSTQKPDLPKDEVGWYFVEQYYTTLSKSPDKLHLFYGKESQFVYGKETDIADIDRGRQEIQNRIKTLDLQDCKVRISNVDSQGSGECIVIQVIGELSNNNAEAKKFVQTFVLAQQPSGYFVLNDIFRYINDDDEVAEPQQPTAESSELAPAPEVERETEPEPVETRETLKELEPEVLDTVAIDKKLEDVESPVAETPVPPAVGEAVSGAPTESAEEEEPVPEPVSGPEKAAEEVAEEEVKQPEDPKAPTPTPVATVTSATPVSTVAPSKPRSYASAALSYAGAASKPTPVVPKIPTAPVSAQSVAAPAKPPAPAVPVPNIVPGPAPSRDQGNEWQTAETKRQNRTAPQVGAPSEKEVTYPGYVKFVTDKVTEDDLKNALSQFGAMPHLDVSRLKNCAFVEFKESASLNAAIAASPLKVNGENIVIEHRRLKASSFGGGSFNNPARAGAGNRGRGGFEPGRSGHQGGRGGFSGQSGRGRGGARGARGQSGAA